MTLFTDSDRSVDRPNQNGGGATQDAGRAPLTLRFTDPSVERDFQAEACHRFRRQVAGTVALGAATWVAAGVLLTALFPFERASLIVAIGIVEAFSLAYAALVPRVRSWNGLQTLSGLVNLTGGTAMIVIGGYLVGLPQLVAPALLVAFAFAFGLSRYGPIGVALTAPYVALYGLLVVSGHLRSNGAFDLFLVVVGYGAAAIGGYLMEANTRDLYWQRRIIASQEAALAIEKEKSERLLQNVLPDHIATRLRERPESVADRLPDVTVLFADLVGFTGYASRLEPDALVSTLDELFSGFDELAARHGLEKIKTIGDAYMAVAGTTAGGDNHPRQAVAMGLDMLALVGSYRERGLLPLDLRVGVSTGPVVAGVIGRSRYSYDLWGDTVNVASRMESQGVAGAIQVSPATAARLAGSYDLQPVGVIDVRGRGPMAPYLVRRSAEPSGQGTLEPAAKLHPASGRHPEALAPEPAQWQATAA